MPVPEFDESIKAAKLPLEVFRWLSEAAIYIRSTPDSAEEVYNVLKLLLRLLAVRNPESQSHATRKALGLLIECIYSQPNTEKVILDLLALLIRMVDASQSHRYNPMKHLAISSLGHLAKFLSVHMKQMSANVFLICVESLKIAPLMPETKRYKNTLLWTMKQSATSSLDDNSIKTASKLARSMIENAEDDEIGVQTTVRGFELLKSLIELPNSKSFEKKLDSLHTLFVAKGISSRRPEVRVAAARFYGAALIALSTHDLKHDMSGAVHAIIKLRNSKNFGTSIETSAKIDGYSILLKELLQAQEELVEFETIFDDWMAPLLLQLDPLLSKSLIVDVILYWKLNGAHSRLDIVAVLLRQLALSQTPMQRQSSSSKSKSIADGIPRLESTLCCLASTVTMLGSSVQPETHAIHQATLGLIMNSSEPLSEEQLPWCIQCLIAIVRSLPPLLISTIEIGLKQLEMDASPRKVQVAYVVGAMVAQSKHFPLYGDVELNSRVALLGASLIRQQGDFAAYKAGWVLFSGIFCLGADVVKPLVSQLLILWEAHLSPEGCQAPTFAERSLTGMALFLYHNKALLTTDVASRLGNVLYTVWSTTEAMPPNPLLRRRLLQCYEQLLIANKLDIYPASLLMKFVAHVTLPSDYSKEAGVTIETAISSSSSTSKTKSGEASMNNLPDLLGELYYAIDSGVVSGGEHLRNSLADDIDHAVFLETDLEAEAGWPFDIPRNVYTTVVDLAVSVTSRLLPLQPLRIQESVFDAILANLENCASQSSLRTLAVPLNIATIIYSTLKHGLNADDRIMPVVITIVKALLTSHSEEVRQLAALSCGVLATGVKGNSKSTAYLAPLVKELLEFTVADQSDMNIRSGAVLALGYIAKEHSQRSLLEAIYKVLMKYAADPRSELHVPIIRSMKHTLMTPDFIDQKYVRLTLKTLSLTYLLESHSNYLPFQKEVADCLTHIVSRIGPLLSTEYQEPNRVIIVCLADHLQADSNVQVRVLAWKSFIEIYYYARHGIPWTLFIKKWKEIIINPRSSMLEIDAAVSGLLILTKLSARSIFSIAGRGFEDALWLLLDKHPRHKELQRLLVTWLIQTSDGDAAIFKWIRTLESVVMKPRYLFLTRLKRATITNSSKRDLKSHEKSASVTPSAIAADEDVALEVQSDDSSNEQLSWESRDFALYMLLQLLQRDLQGKSNTEKPACATTRSIGDIVKIAFSSATSQILGLQYSGLLLLNEIIYQLSDLTDPDFPQISLLEQYQVQIISALTPAFGLDSSPGLALKALSTSATFIVSDIVKTREKLNRLIKIVEESLESMSSGTFKLGTLDMSQDAAEVLKIAVLSVWAQIQNNSTSKIHLQEIVEPKKTQLMEFWRDAVYDFGKRNSALVSQWSSSAFSDAVIQVREIQHRHLMDPISDSTWLKFVRALSTIDDGDDIDADFRLILCGLCFQALLETLQSTASGSSTIAAGESDESSLTVSNYITKVGRRDYAADNIAAESHPEFQRTMDSSPTSFRQPVLKVLGAVLNPATCALIMESSPDYFDEVVPILYRAMLIGSSDEKASVLKIAHALVAGQPDTDDSVDHFFEILKVAMLPLRTMFPQLFESEPVSLNGPASTPHSRLDAEQLSLLQLTMDAVIDIAQVFREIIQNDLWVCLLKVFEELNHYEPAVVAPSFKRLLEILATQVEQRGIIFVVDALTVSLKRAVERDSELESLLICTAITCTNSRSLYAPSALVHVQRFGARAGDALLRASSPDCSEEIYRIGLTSVQCISAVIRACADTPTGGAFAYASLPALCELVSKRSNIATAYSSELVKQSANALSLYAVLDGTLETFSVVVPSLVLLAGTYGRHMLLQILTKHPIVFKQTIWRMDDDDQKLVQDLLAQPIDSGSTASVADNSDGEDDTEIALKSFI